MAVIDQPTNTVPSQGDQPRLADGVDLIGEYAGSGYKDPPALVRRGDGQVIQLTELLYLVAKQADGTKNLEGIAEAVSAEYEKNVSADNVRTLVDEKLRPMGILAQADGTSPQLEKPDPLLALRFRKQVIPERLARTVSLPFKPLFWPPVILAALAAFVAFDVWLFANHGIAQGMRQAMYEPGLMLVVFGMIVISAGWHEFGHAAGCAYGGGCPGGMGAGIYLAYPAFYTDVTDSYRLSRGGRLRTDLAGVYFNILFVLATAGLYAVTRWEPLLLVVVVQHFEMVHQLLPFLRLDGYYIVADLTGVPDLFARIKPILMSAIPFRRPDEQVLRLKRWVRVVVTAWVLIVFPLLLFQLGMLLLHLPRIVGTAVDALGKQWTAATTALGDGRVLSALAAGAQALILLVPLLGIALLLYRLGQRAYQSAWKNTQGRPVARSLATAGTLALVAALVWIWLPNGDYDPIQRGERGTLADGVAAVSHVRSGRSSLAARDRADARGDLDRAAPAADRSAPTSDDESTPASTTSTTTFGSDSHTATSLRSSVTSTTIDRTEDTTP